MLKKALSLFLGVSMLFGSIGFSFADSTYPGITNQDINSITISENVSKDPIETNAGGKFVVKQAMKALAKQLRGEGLDQLVDTIESACGKTAAKQFRNAAEPLANRLDKLIEVEEYGMEAIQAQFTSVLTNCGVPLSVAKGIAYALRLVLEVAI